VAAVRGPGLEALAYLPGCAGMTAEAARRIASRDSVSKARAIRAIHSVRRRPPAPPDNGYAVACPAAQGACGWAAGGRPEPAATPCCAGGLWSGTGIGRTDCYTSGPGGARRQGSAGCLRRL
jgi:hypothetical protein